MSDVSRSEPTVPGDVSRSEPTVPSDVSRSEPTVPKHPARWLALLGVPAALGGTVAFALGQGNKGAWSYLAGFGVALLVVVGAGLFVDVAARVNPRFALLAAMLNYILTVLVFLLVLVAVDRSRISVAAFATGLAAAVVPYVGWHLSKANAKAHEPVTETLLPWPDDEDEDEDDA